MPRNDDPLFRRPGGMVFPKIYVKESFGGQDVNRQAAVPQSDAEAQLALAFEIELVPVNRDFEDAFERGLCDEFGIQQADKSPFDRKLLDVATLQLHDDGDFFSAADSDAEFGIFQLAECLVEWFDSDAEAPL